MCLRAKENLCAFAIGNVREWLFRSREWMEASSFAPDGKSIDTAVNLAQRSEPQLCPCCIQDLLWLGVGSLCLQTFAPTEESPVDGSHGHHRSLQVARKSPGKQDAPGRPKVGNAQVGVKSSESPHAHGNHALSGRSPGPRRWLKG